MPVPSSRILRSPVFQVVSTWIWWALGAAVTIGLLLLALGADPGQGLGALAERRHLIVYVEIVSVGLLPVLYTVLMRQDPGDFGLRRAGWARSLSLGLLFVAVMYGVALARSGQIMTDDRPSLVVEAPWAIFYGLLGIAAWGPLEVFFVVWLAARTDAIFGSPRRLLSPGIAITIVLFGLIHVLTTSAFNAAYTAAIFVALLLIVRRTGNILGPALAWTLINGQVWYVARLLT